ncbi:MAG TPA: hypothetical protein VF733_06200 [Candidatus Saccharimonadales bacterium]
MNKILKQSLVVAMALVATTVAPAFISMQDVYAQPTQEQAQERQENEQAEGRQGRENAQANVQERREAAQTRSQDAKLRACQNREKAIKNIMARIANRGEKHIELFTTIADRAKTFYADKNLKIDNYDALVAEVDAKKAAAQVTVNEVKNSSMAFVCDGDGPKGMADAFKASLKSEIKALQEYRTAVKNLIVGIKSAHNTANAEDGDQ